uniref:Uncharacterized protein n=1 Tax=Glycine max TaxID=3847 RepID=C6T9T2_SOYBN|nr:unknown [Glycine max]
MNVVRRRLLHTLRGGAAPSETLKRRALELEKKRKTRHSKTKDQFIVTAPESLSFLDTATIPMYFAAIGIALLAKLLMTYDDSRSQELLERKIKNAPKGRGSVKMSHQRSGRSIEKSGPGLRLSPRLPALIPK